MSIQRIKEIEFSLILMAFLLYLMQVRTCIVMGRVSYFATLSKQLGQWLLLLTFDLFLYLSSIYLLSIFYLSISLFTTKLLLERGQLARRLAALKIPTLLLEIQSIYQPKTVTFNAIWHEVSFEFCCQKIREISHQRLLVSLVLTQKRKNSNV